MKPTGFTTQEATNFRRRVQATVRSILAKVVRLNRIDQAQVTRSSVPPRGAAPCKPYLSVPWPREANLIQHEKPCQSLYNNVSLLRPPPGALTNLRRPAYSTNLLARMTVDFARLPRAVDLTLRACRALSRAV